MGHFVDFPSSAVLYTIYFHPKKLWALTKFPITAFPSSLFLSPKRPPRQTRNAGRKVWVGWGWGWGRGEKNQSSFFYPLPLGNTRKVFVRKKKTMKSSLPPPFSPVDGSDHLFFYFFLSFPFISQCTKVSEVVGRGGGGGGGGREGRGVPLRDRKCPWECWRRKRGGRERMLQRRGRRAGREEEENPFFLFFLSQIFVGDVCFLATTSLSSSSSSPSSNEAALILKKYFLLLHKVWSVVPTLIESTPPPPPPPPPPPRQCQNTSPLGEHHNWEGKISKEGEEEKNLSRRLKLVRFSLFLRL